MKTLKKLFFAGFTSLALTATPLVMAEMIITHVSPLNKDDHRHDYGIDLLRLSLEKTVKDFGPYKMVGAPKMNQARGMESVRENRYTNLIRTFGYEQRFERDLDMTYVRFPIHLGVVGYRVCFIPEALQEQMHEVKTKEDLKQFVHGQGRRWADVEILRHNGFKVNELEYESLFKMIAAKRLDMFCRGVNEIKDEYERHKIPGLKIDDAVVIFYPLPRFYYTHKDNKEAAHRIDTGLKRAYKDGSIQALWEKSYRSSIDYVKLQERRFFFFDSPLVKTIDFDYDEYFLHLNEEAASK